MSSILTEALSASVGGAISSATLFPLEIIKTRAQAAGVSNSTSSEEDNDQDDSLENGSKNKDEAQATAAPPTTLAIAEDIYKTSGIAGFWENFHFSSIQSATEKGIYFLAYTALKGGYESMMGRRASTFESLLLGCAGEWAHLPVSMPMDVLTTKLATNKST